MEGRTPALGSFRSGDGHGSPVAAPPITVRPVTVSAEFFNELADGVTVVSLLHHRRRQDQVGEKVVGRPPRPPTLLAECSAAAEA